MTTNDDTTLLVLNNLIMAMKDAEQGYQAAADRVGVPELAELFEANVRQRTKFVLELQNRVRALRSTPAKTGTPVGALHRGWMGLKAALESNETHAILAECERGDDMSLKLFGSALKEIDIDRQSRELIQQQYEQVQAAHDRVRQLRDGETYAHR